MSENHNVATQDYWGQLSRQIAGAVEHVARHIVAVHARPRMASTGIIWSERTLVTAAHTVTQDEEVRVTLPGGDVVGAKLIGRDAGTDLAALRIDGSLHAAVRAPSASLAPGHWVVAVARLSSSGVAASAALVSEVGPGWRTWRGGVIDQAIRLDRPLGAGFSGAPLIDESGAVLGLCTAGFGRGRSLVIPATTVDRVFRELDQKGHVSRAYVGLAMQGVRLSEAVSRKVAMRSACGALVVSVQSQAPAEQAGIMVGDVLIELGGKPVGDAGDVQDVLAETRAGDALPAVLIRGGERMECPIVTAERPSIRPAC
jgi:serine protease Do